MRATIGTSILTADFANLGAAFKMLERHPVIGYIHMDVMDGHFVPNISYGAPVVRSLADATKLRFDIHLMIAEPERYAKDYLTANTEFIVFHAEAVDDIRRAADYIKSLGVKCGAAISPDTPVSMVADALDILDQALVMSVYPGFGGQAFLTTAPAKISELYRLRRERGLSFKIGVDGGINRSNIPDVIDAGADIITVGSAILCAGDPEEELTAYEEILNGGEA